MLVFLGFVFILVGKLVMYYVSFDLCKIFSNLLFLLNVCFYVGIIRILFTIEVL